MGLNYKNLDDTTRRFMLEEIDWQVSTPEGLYLSDNLNPQGRADYPALLRTAAEGGSDDSLAAELRARLNTHEKPRRLPSGGLSNPPIMRKNAHEMLAEGEFNRFYIRGVCRRAIEGGTNEVTVYRAKAVEHARSASEAMIGKRMSAEALLNDLRNRQGVDTALGLPPGPNSGLSVHLP